MNAKLQIGKRGQTTELNGRSPLRRRRCALDCSSIEEKKKKKKKKKMMMMMMMMMIS
jgi:hypothetical protein